MTEVTRLAAAALAVRDALDRFDGNVDAATVGLRIFAVSKNDEDERVIRAVVADVEKRFEISIELEIEWR